MHFAVFTKSDFMVMSPMHRILCFLNHNRHTGKTATIRNLAAARALGGKPTLLLISESALPSPVWLSPIENTNLYEDREIPGLFYSIIHGDQRGSSPESLKAQIAEASDRLPADTLFFWDTPSALSPHTRAALDFAHGVFIPFPMDASSFDRLGPSLGLLEWMRRKKNSPLPLLALIPVCVQEKAHLSQIFSGPALGLFRSRMAATPIPKDSCLHRAEAANRPVFCQDLLAPAALAFHLLYQWIEEKRLHTVQSVCDEGNVNSCDQKGVDP